MKINEFTSKYFLTEQANVIELNTTAKKVLETAAKIMDEIVAKYKNKEAKSRTSPSAPDTSKFTSTAEGMIQRVQDEYVHGGYYGIPKNYKEFLKIGSAVDSATRNNIIQSFYAGMEEEFNGWNEKTVIKTTTGFSISVSTEYGTAWGGVGVSIYKPKPKVQENEKLNLPTIEVGDEVKIGKFKNRKAEVKGFTKDKDNQPVLKTSKGEKKALNFKFEKLNESMSFNPAKLENGNRLNWVFPDNWTDPYIYKKDEHGKENFREEPEDNPEYRPDLDLSLAGNNMVDVMDTLGFDFAGDYAMSIPIDQFIGVATSWLQKNIGKTSKEVPTKVDAEPGKATMISPGKGAGYYNKTIMKMIKIAQEGKKMGATHISIA